MQLASPLTYYLCLPDHFKTQPQIIQARDLVESAVKPGSSSLQILGAMTPIIRKLGPDADASNLGRLPIAAAGFWAFYAGELY